MRVVAREDWARLGDVRSEDECSCLKDTPARMRCRLVCERVLPVPLVTIDCLFAYGDES